MAVLGIDFGTAATRVVLAEAGEPWRTAEPMTTGSNARGIKRLLGREAQVDASVRALLASACEAPLRRGVAEAVLAVPGWYEPAQRAALQRCAEGAGLRVRELMLDAAAAAHWICRDEPSTGPFAIIDAGAGGITAGFFERRNGEVRVIASESARVGGDDIDASMARTVGELDGAARELLEACEAMKRELARAPAGASASRALPGTGRTVRFERHELELLVETVLGPLRELCHRLLDHAGLSGPALDAVYLTGGTSGLERSGDVVASVFGQAPIPAPAHAVVRGAALRAATLAGVATAPAPLPKPLSMPPPSVSVGLKQPQRFRPEVKRTRVQPGSNRRSPSVPPPSAQPSDPPLRPSVPPIIHAPVSEPPVRDSQPHGPVTLSPPSSSPRPSLPSVQSTGRLAAPPTAAALLGLAMARAPRPDELDPIALPVLLRLLARRSLQGTLLVEGSGLGAKFVVVDGSFELDRLEHTDFLRAFELPEARYALENGRGARAGRASYSAASLAIEGLRALLRRHSIEELTAALAAKLERSPVVPIDRSAGLRRIGLETRELRLCETHLDGTRAGSWLVTHGGLGPHSTLSLFALLELFQLLSWTDVAVQQRVSRAEEIERRAHKLEGANFFDVLGVHWSATSEEIREKHQRLVREHEPQSEAAAIAPAACARILERLEQAYQCLRDDTRRAAYRKVAYHELDFEAASELAAQHSKSLELRGLDSEARRSQDRANELSKSVDRRAAKITQEALDAAVRRAERKASPGDDER